MFEKIFNMDNAVWRAMAKVADLVIANLLFLVCSIPIVTIGASMTALYTVTLKMVDKSGGYVSKDFWSAFKSNFKQSTIIWLIMLAVGVFIAGDYYLVSQMVATVGKAVKYIVLILAFLYFMIISYVFPLQSKFENTIVRTITNAAMTSIANLVPWTILITLVNVLPVFSLLGSVELFIDIILPVMILLGFSTIAWLNSFMFQKVFARYIPEEEEVIEEVVETE